MKEVKKLKKLSKSFLHKDKHKKINKIKEKEEKLALLKNSLVSELRLKHLELDILVKKVKDKKKRHLFHLKSNLISPKISLLNLDFNEKDFKKIDSLINKLKEEVLNV